MTRQSAKVLWEPNPGQQSIFCATDVHECLYGGAAGGGKALGVDTPIATPCGWSTMGDLSPGDTVFDENGEPCSVLACSEVMLERPCYEVVFSDGSVIVADADHLWQTSTDSERSNEKKRTPEYRARRKSMRLSEQESRRKGRRSTRKDLSARNIAQALAKQENGQLLSGCRVSVVTTRQIAATLITKRGAKNHAVDVAKALVLPDAQLPIDPYVLGVWLGDGTSASGGITSADNEIIEEIRSAGFDVNKLSSAYAWGIHGGLYKSLRLNGLIGNKHIPDTYLRASAGQRLALLQGLMDTDGYVDHRGQCEFTTTSERLRDGAIELILSLGIKATVSTGKATLRGIVVGNKYRIKFITHLPAFRLPRKLTRQKRDSFRGTHERRYIVDVRAVASVPVRCIAVSSPSKLYLAGRSMIPTHNSASLVASPLRWCHVPQFRGLILRRESTQLGNLLDKAGDLYDRVYPGAYFHTQKSRWIFPSGATIWFSHCENTDDYKRYDGDEFQYIGFDELTHFTLTQYQRIKSRLRSTTPGLPRHCRATTNPGGPGHEWVFNRWGPWLDPACKMKGAIGDGITPPVAKNEIISVLTPKDGPEERVPHYTPNSRMRQFIPARIADNPKLLKEDPDYVANLRDNDRVRRAQLEDGNWLIKPAAGLYFQRGWVRMIDTMPLDLLGTVRYWDRASTTDGDWTAGCKMSKSADGRFIVSDIVHTRGTPRHVINTIKNTAISDGPKVQQVLEQDPGSAGVVEKDTYVQELAGHSFSFQKPTGDKVTRFGPFSSQCEAGNVDVLIGAWNDAYFSELESFPDGDYDDQCDASSGAFSRVAQASRAIKAKRQEDRRSMQGW